jgi:hypothetical protein
LHGVILKVLAAVVSNLPTNPLDVKNIPKMKTLVTRYVQEISTTHKCDDAESTATSPKPFPILKLTIKQWRSRLPEQLSAELDLHNLPGTPEEATETPYESANRHGLVPQPHSLDSNPRVIDDTDKHFLPLIEGYKRKFNKLEGIIRELDRKAEEIREEKEQAQKNKEQCQEFIKKLEDMKTRDDLMTIDGASASGAPGVERRGSVVEDSEASGGSQVIQ